MKQKPIKLFLEPHKAFQSLSSCTGSLLLETQSPSAHERYSFMACKPEKIFKGDIHTLNSQEFFDFIDDYREDNLLAGYIGYEACQWIEDIPRPGPKDFSSPHIYLAVYPSFMVFDHLAHAWSYVGDPFEIITPADNGKDIVVPAGKITGTNQTKEEYIDNINKALKFISEGDVYQINYTQRFYFELEKTDPYLLYLQLRDIQPVAYGAFINTGSGVVISGSPELFIRVQEGKILSKPMKGTRKRSSDPILDLKLRQELIESSKEQAENIMIVDLMRNDLGRFCRFGSIQVPKLYDIEQYTTVYQMVSHVEGAIQSRTKYSDIIRDVFPPGSVTGTPKKRAMEIIYGLEPNARGVYCGMIGYIWNDRMVFNVAIRTLELAHSQGVFGVGGGIVADSDPEKEYEESLVKAKAIMMALGIES
ncbi:MAG: aminodeoxychorismate synthase component I [Pseudomonadota bacterium]